MHAILTFVLPLGPLMLHFHCCQNTATLGKKGLGTGSLPKKVAGARWKGQKVTFEELDDGSDKDSDKDSSQGRDGEAAERDSSGSGDASAETSAKVGGGKRKRKRVEATREEGGAHAIKWKKILLSVLKKVRSPQPIPACILLLPVPFLLHFACARGGAS